MMKLKALLLCFVLFSACRNTHDVQLDHLNGYWEIQKVVTEDGEEKVYEVNPTIDYFEIKNQKGIRKKVQPQADGSYLRSKDQTNFEIVPEKRSIFIIFKNRDEVWKEQLLTLTEKELVLESGRGIVYHYTRYEPLETNKR